MPCVHGTGLACAHVALGIVAAVFASVVLLQVVVSVLAWAVCMLELRAQ